MRMTARPILGSRFPESAEALSGAGLLCWGGNQTGHSDQIVGRSDEVRGQLRSLDAFEARSPKAADGLRPAEDFLDALSNALAHGVARMARRAPIDRRGTAGVLRHVGRDVVH